MTSAAARRTIFKVWPLGLLLVCLLVLYFARTVLIPLALATTLAFVLTPAIVWLQKLHVGRTPAVLIVVFGTIGIVGYTGSIVASQLLTVISQLPDYRDNLSAKLSTLRNPTTGALGRAAETVRELGSEISKTTPEPVPKNSLRGVAPPTRPLPVEIVSPSKTGLAYFGGFLYPIVQPLELAVVVLIFSIFMLIKREDLRNRLFRLAGLAKFNMVTQVLDDSAQRVSRYLLMQVCVNGLFGVAFGFGLHFIGVPAATLWGVLAGLARFVPYVGALAAGAAPLLLSVAMFDGWHAPLMVFVLFLGLELLTANAIEPWLYGAHTGVAPLALLVATAFWTMLWGWAGLLLSTPLTVCLSALGRYVPELSFLHVLLGDEDVLEPRAQFYQRLLAMDQDEVRAIAERFIETHSLVELYDSVVIPALSLAEQDRHKGALDDTHEAFIFLSARELIAELPSSGVENQGPARGRTVCIPANDQADEVSASMLGQLLEHGGLNAIVLPLSSHAERSLARLSLGPDDMVCISALPPFAFARARALCHNLKARVPQSKITVGFWGIAADEAVFLKRFGREVPDRVFMTLNEAVRQAIEWQRESDPQMVTNGSIDASMTRLVGRPPARS